LARLELPLEEERKRSEQAHADRLRRDRPVPTPPAARRLLGRLTAELPPHLGGFPYSLTVFDAGDYRASTPGGGLIHISNDLLGKLLADPRRGESALAFVLAREVGHVALGHCRRGWQRLILEEHLTSGPIALVEPAACRAVLDTKVRVGGVALSFLYSRD